MTGNKGFTLIETVVALGIFIAISAGLGEVISVSIQNQVKIVAMQNTFSQAIFSLDKIEKELRMAKKDLSGSCVGATGRNYNVVQGTPSDSITFLFLDQDLGLRCKKYTVEYTVEGGQIKEYISANTTSTFTTGINVTSSLYSVNSLKFILTGDTSSQDNLQPKITILMNISNDYLSPMNIQTTISQRRLDL